MRKMSRGKENRVSYLREAAMAFRDGVGDLATTMQGLPGMTKMALGVAQMGR